MVSLAQAFADINKAPPKPQAPPKVSAAPGPAPTPPTPTVQDNRKKAPATNSATMQSGKSKAPSTPRTGGDIPSGAAVSDDSLGGLSAPTCFGLNRQFNYTTRKMATTIMCRTILHNGVSKQDIEFEWVSPRLLKIRVAWPQWFQMAEQMAQFCVDDQQHMLYPPEHPLTTDTSMRNQTLVEEDGRIWDDGYLSFDQDMKVDDDPSFELLDVEITSQATTVKVLQMFVPVAPIDETGGGSRNTVSKTWKVTLGTGPRSSDDNDKVRKKRNDDPEDDNKKTKS